MHIINNYKKTIDKPPKMCYKYLFRSGINKSHREVIWYYLRQNFQ